MAGLDPAIHVFGLREQDVDARVKPGHDEGWGQEWLPKNLCCNGSVT
jgi:hypothetical protein